MKFENLNKSMTKRLMNVTRDEGEQGWIWRGRGQGAEAEALPHSVWHTLC